MELPELQRLCEKNLCWPIVKFSTTQQVTCSIYIKNFLVAEAKADSKTQSQKLACILAAKKLKNLGKEIGEMSLPRFHKKSFDSDFEVTEKVLEKSSIYNKFPLVYSDSRSEYEEFYEAILKLNILTPLEDCKIMQANNFLQEISMVLKKYGVRDLIKVHSISIRDLIENKYIATISDENQSFAQEICLDIVDSLYETTDFQAYFSGNSGNSVDFVDFPLEILIIPESFSTFFEKSASQRQLKVMKLLRIWKKNKSDISNNILDYIVLNNTHELYTLSSAFRTCLEAISGGILLNLYQSYGFLNIETVIMAQHLAQDTLFLLSQGEVIKIFE